MNKRHYEHTLPNIRGSLSNTYEQSHGSVIDNLVEVTGTGGVFMPSVAPTEDEKEAERLRRKKKRRKGRSL